MLEEKIFSDHKEAMKARDAVRVGTLSFLRSQFKYVLIEKKADKLEDADVIAVIKKQIKQRQDSIEQYELGGRADLVAKEKAEMAILKAYLPEDMPADQLRAAVAEAVKEAGAVSMKDMGKVMPLVLAKVGGKADSRTVSEFVKQALTK